MMKRISAVLLAWACVLALFSCEKALAAGDSVQIVSITPGSVANYADEVTFTVMASYTLQSAESGVVYLGFNTNTPERYALVDEVHVSRGSGSVTLTGRVVPSGWGTADSPSGPVQSSIELMNGDTFGAYVNLSADPHPESWTPLAHAVWPLGQGTISLPDLPDFVFASGVGAWSTEVTVYEDGTFEGYYHDADAGDSGEGYPDGTLYYCYFQGAFTDIRRVGKYEYSMRLASIAVGEAVDTVTIVEGVRYIAAEPYGFHDADEFLLYLPGRPTADLPMEFMDWMTTSAALSYDNPPPALPFYGLYNVGGEAGFSSGYTQEALETLELRYRPEYDEGVARVAWGDALFEQPSTEYSHDIALVAAAMTAGASGKAEFLRGKASGETALVGDYEGTYNRLGFSNLEYYNYEGDFATELEGSKRNEHCFSIASKEITVHGESQLLVAVILRGTESFWGESMGDAFASYGSRDYHGYDAYNYFVDYADKAWGAFTRYVEQNRMEWHAGVKVLVGGHSLGGAAANLFAARFKLDGGQGICETDDVYAYTFGALNSLVVNRSWEWFTWHYSWINPLDGFGYIYNFFNYHDTYGPNASGTMGVRPAYGDITCTSKFGPVLVFRHAKEEAFDRARYGGDAKYANHNMPCYVDAIAGGFSTEEGAPVGEM